MPTPAIEFVTDDLVMANRILSNEDILDAFGHVTARHPTADRMLVSAYQSPSLVERDDVIEMTLDGNVLADDIDEIYSENVLHRAIYRNRDDVNAVVHCHAPALLPFALTDTELKPVTQIAAPFHDGVPKFDDYGPERGLLVVDEDEGQRMADALGDKQAQLLVGHGANVVGSDVREAVVLTSNLVTNASYQVAAEQFGDLTPLVDTDVFAESAGEVIRNPRTINRVWEYLVDRL